MIEIDKNILLQTADELKDRSVKISTFAELGNFSVCEKNEVFDFCELNTNKSKAFLNEIIKWEKENDLKNKENSLYIYLFELVDKSSIELFKKTFSRTLEMNPKPKTEGWRAFSRFIKDHNSTLLYVGSSENISTRIAEHLGMQLSDGHKDKKTTYALHMKHWQNPYPIGKFNIKIYKLSSSVDRTTMQAIEDAIWSKYRPCFGKQGPK